MDKVFVFDVETVPDVDSARRMYGLKGLDDRDVAALMFRRRRQETGSDFLRHHLHRIVAISVVLRAADRFKVWSLGSSSASEHELIQRFFDGLEKYDATLVSWNGSAFDLPVLHYRAMLHGVCSQRYWEVGEADSRFRWNNYLNRFHYRHTDLMDVLSGYQMRAATPLSEMATMLGLPGKLGMDGAQVWDRYLAGDIAGIRNYCETDVLNTYLLYLRFELIRARLTEDEYRAESEQVRGSLAREQQPHLDAFLQAWERSVPLPG